jgi:DNA-binding response OmpR family regulator
MPGQQPEPLRALVVEDDAGIAEFVQLGLRYEGFDVRMCADGTRALRTAEQWHADVVVLDWMLPGLDGLEVCRRLRAYGDPAIVMLTARDSVEDRVLGLESGADDYVVKPFAFVELAARIRSVLRRRASQAESTLQFAGLELNCCTCCSSSRGGSIPSTPSSNVCGASISPATTTSSRSIFAICGKS